MTDDPNDADRMAEEAMAARSDRQTVIDTVVEKNAPIARKLTAIRYNISEEEVVRRVNEEGPEGDEVADTYWSILDEFIKMAETS